jgi:hypothetical protein
MLRQGFAAVGRQRDDLHLRVHVLSRLRRKPSQRRVPQLRGQFCVAPGAAAARACEQPAVDATRFQPGQLRRLEHDPEKPAPDLIRGEHRFSEKITLKQQSKVK